MPFSRLSAHRCFNQAATFGKTFLDLYNPADFVQMTHTLRVLNAARFFEIGIPLTYEQYVLFIIRCQDSYSNPGARRYQAHPPSHLIARLTSRAQHLLSLRISTFLHLSPAPVLKHWAQAKIAAAKGAEDDDEICRTIVDKLRDQDDVSCADVAQTAWATGQSVLATKVGRIVKWAGSWADGDLYSYWTMSLGRRSRCRSC